MRHRLLLACASALLFTVAAAASTVAPAFKLPVPAEVRALGAMVGAGRQRLALVISQPRAAGLDLPATTRDAQAVAAALAANGYVVMRRDDVGAAALRAALNEFRGRLAPSDAGFVYLAGAGAQVDGQSLLLTRDLRSPAGASAQSLRDASLPLAEVIEALQITPGSLRLLVVDAAPPLPDLPPAHRGLATPVLPQGVMALLSAMPGTELTPLRPPPWPTPVPTDPRALAGSPFGTALVHALTSPGVSGPNALRDARRLALDGTGGRIQPWLGGQTDDDDSLGSPDFTTALLPRLPEKVIVGAVQRAAGLRAEDLAARADPAPQPDAPGALPTVGAVAGVVGTAIAVAGTVGGAADAVQALPAGVVAGVSGTVADLAADAARQAAGSGAGAGGAPGGQPLDTRLPDQREAVDGPGLPSASAPPLATPAIAPPATPPASPPIATPTPPPPAAPPTAAPTVPVVLPVAPPTTHPHGYAPGDEFTYRRIDQWKGEMTGLVVQVIRRLGPDGEIEARENDAEQRLDPQGRTRSRSGPAGQSVFEPVEQFWWPDPKPGDSRDVDFTETFRTPDGHGVRRWKGDVEVGQPEWLQTPAGRFRVVPMAGDGWYHEINRRTGQRRSVMWERTVWYAPELGHPVAVDILERDANSRRLRKERLELLHAQNSRTVPR